MLVYLVGGATPVSFSFVHCIDVSASDSHENGQIRAFCPHILGYPVLVSSPRNTVECEMNRTIPERQNNYCTANTFTQMA